MIEQKVYEGVYFTDYRQTESKPKIDKKEAATLPTFIKIDQIEKISTPEDLDYKFGEVFKKYKWIQYSTLEMMNQSKDREIMEYVKENIQVAKKYRDMIELMLQKAGEMKIHKELGGVTRAELEKEILTTVEIDKKLPAYLLEAENVNEDEGIFV